MYILTIENLIFVANFKTYETGIGLINKCIWCLVVATTKYLKNAQKKNRLREINP